MTKKTKGGIGTGATIARRSVANWAMRQKRKLDGSKALEAPGQITLLDGLLAWLKQQPVRTLRPGGIGRK